jgi:general stress protein CsbA
MVVKIVLWFWWLYYCAVLLVGTSLLKEDAASFFKIGLNKVVMVFGCIIIGERDQFFMRNNFTSK